MSVRPLVPALALFASLFAFACQPPVPEDGDSDTADTDTGSTDTGGTDTGGTDTGGTFDTADSAA